MQDVNPLLSFYDLPPFSAIGVEHWEHAIEEKIAVSRIKVAEIIVSQTALATWDDLVLAMDEVKAQLDYTLAVIKIANCGMTQKGAQKAVERCSDLVMAYKMELAQSNALFSLYHSLANSQIAASFDKPRQSVLQNILREFHLSGAHLPRDEQQHLRELEVEIKLLEHTFKSRIRQASEAWSKHIEDESQLTGLSDQVKRLMAHKSEEKNLQGWLLTLSDDVFGAVMRYADHRPLRQQVWMAYHARASTAGLCAESLNNDDILTLLLNERHEKARLLGYESFAELALEGQAVRSTEDVLAFLRNALDDQRNVFAQEAVQLKAFAVEQGITELEPWDYEYLAEKLRHYPTSAQDKLSAYYPLETVLKRLCDFTQRLFGVELVECSNFDRWHNDVRLFELREFNQTIGYLFIDPYQRESSSGAADSLILRSRYVTAEGQTRLPIAVLRTKLMLEPADKPCLLDHQQLRMLMREWGHCLQQLLTRQNVSDLCGINGLGHDRVEFAGQLLEQWCFAEHFLIWMSCHYQTGEQLPANMAQRLITASRTQTSWRTAHRIGVMLFDVEVHMTPANGLSVQNVFDDVNTEIGHLKWPTDARGIYSCEFLASSDAARMYSYKWSKALASTVFDRFATHGVFDHEVGRACRDAFFTQGASRSLKVALDTFLGVPSSSWLFPGPVESGLSKTDFGRRLGALAQDLNGIDPALLISQLTTSQLQMIRLNEAVVQPRSVATQCLNEGLREVLPALADNITAEVLSVRTATGTFPLETLFWRAAAGDVEVNKVFLNRDDIAIVQTKDGMAQEPEALNTHEAKGKIERLIETLPISYPQLLARALDDFWGQPAEFTQGRNVSDWLATELSSQLSAQAHLLQLDGTLVSPLHKAVTDLLSAPDAVSREPMMGTRPGVYALQHTAPRWGSLLPVTGALVLAQRADNDELAHAVLWRPGKPLEVVDSLTRLSNILKDSGEAEGELHVVPVPENFLLRQVSELRQEQKDCVLDVLFFGLQEAEAISTWLERLDAAADIGTRLDLSVPMDIREHQQALEKLDDWLWGNRYITGKDRLAWWSAMQDWLKDMTQSPSPPSDPVTLATAQAIQDWTRTELARLLKDKHASADPDQVFLGIEKQEIDPHAPRGTSAFESGAVVSRNKKTFLDTRSMTQWAISNLTPEERNARFHDVEGPLSYADVLDMIETANVGERFAQWLNAQCREQQTQWMTLKGKEMRAQVLAAHISGDLEYDRANTSLNLVLAALDSPQPAGRNKVNGHDVVVRQLQWGDEVLKEVLVFGVKTLGSRPSLTLYTPQAPDGKVFRDVDAGSTRELTNAVKRALTATPEMTLWLISTLPLMKQAGPVKRIEPGATPLTTREKIKQVTQSVLSGTQFKAANDFFLKASFPVVNANMLQVLYETQLTHALETADALTVSNAERDSAAVQQGRLKGLELLLGMFSMFPTGPLGGLLGRATIALVVGGAAVTSIKEHGGSAGQWLSEFLNWMGEVLSQSGEDLIMSRFGKTRIARSSLAPMQDPQFKPYLLKGYDGAGLLSNGRDLYRDASGQGYLKQGQNYLKTAVQDGEQIIYAPNNRSNQRTVTWKDGRWQLKERLGLLGGGPIMSAFSRTPQPPELQKYTVLLEAVLPHIDVHSPGGARRVKNSIDAMPDELAKLILTETMLDMAVSDTATFRSRIHQLRAPAKVGGLLHKFHLWSAVNKFVSGYEAHDASIRFTDKQKIRLYDVALRNKKMFLADGGSVYLEVVSLPDPLTGAIYIIFVPKQGRVKQAVRKIEALDEKMRNAVKIKVDAELASKLSTLGVGRNEYFGTPGNFEVYNQNMITAYKQALLDGNRPGLLTEIRANRIPYSIYKKGASQRKELFMITEEDINHFSKTLSKYQDPFEVEAITKATSHKVQAGTPVTSLPKGGSETSAVTHTFAVNISELASAQMTYDNFSDKANLKITAILDDIRAGRVSTKTFNGYYWYDMAQLDPGRGRGAWRAAFEREGNTWTLQGFYDYHGNQPATVWG